MTIPVIAYGNPIDGITIIGPFKTLDQATEWAEANLEDADPERFFCPVPLFSPEEFLSGEARER
jgi:hypothetical protein